MSSAGRRRQRLLRGGPGLAWLMVGVGGLLGCAITAAQDVDAHNLAVDLHADGRTAHATLTQATTTSKGEPIVKVTFPAAGTGPVSLTGAFGKVQQGTYEGVPEGGSIAVAYTPRRPVRAMAAADVAELWDAAPVSPAPVVIAGLCLVPIGVGVWLLVHVPPPRPGFTPRPRH